MAPTPEQIKLIRDFEPVLFFQGSGPAGGPAERFFPSDAKRYVEHCALWKASAPFTARADWGTGPIIAAAKIRTIENEGETYLGKGLPNGPFDFLETPADKECFLEMTGWEPPGTPFPPADRFADLNRLAQRYRDEPALNESQFWYHAEFFDFPRLRGLFLDARTTGKTNIDFMTLLAGSESKPPILSDPALICYYLFYPGHDEGLQGCSGINEAKQFGSFAGEWTCIALLLNRPDVNSPYSPKFVGLTNRNSGVIQVPGREARLIMRILPWTAMKLFDNTHPGFEVGKGSHAYFVPGEPPVSLDPRTGADQSAGDCGLPKDVVEEMAHSDDYGLGDGLTDIFVVPWVKALAGAKAGLALGPIGVLGAVAGLVWGMVEGHDKMDGLKVKGTPRPDPTIDIVGTSGTVVHPENVIPPGVNPSRLQKWRSQEALMIGNPPRRYDSTVDRAQQILWPDEPQPNPPSAGAPNPNHKGYTGRWGPRVESDMETRRTGMRFPIFWLLFFEELVRNSRPSIVRFLTVDSGASWTVPADWNNADNTVECVGGGAAEPAHGPTIISAVREAVGARMPRALISLSLPAPPSRTTSEQAAPAVLRQRVAAATRLPAATRGSIVRLSQHPVRLAEREGQRRMPARPAKGARPQRHTARVPTPSLRAAAMAVQAPPPALDRAAAAAAQPALAAPATVELPVRTRSLVPGGTGDGGNTPAGGNGTQWDVTHGSGGGGNGGNQAPGADGGLYGGGGGGGGFVAGAGRPGGKGSDGLIVITWTP